MEDSGGRWYAVIPVGCASIRELLASGYAHTKGDDMVQLFRQGDVVFLPLTAEQATRVRAEYKYPTNTVLKEGEATGHKHQATGDSVAVLAPMADRQEANAWSLQDTRQIVQSAGLSPELLGTSLYLTAEGAIKVVHEEHGTLTLKRGNYLVFSQREYSEEQNRQVLD